MEGQVKVGGGNGAMEFETPRGDFELCNELDLLDDYDDACLLSDSGLDDSDGHEKANWMSVRAATKVLLCELDVAALKAGLTEVDQRTIEKRLVAHSTAMAEVFENECVRQTKASGYVITPERGFAPREIAHIAKKMWRFQYGLEEFVARDEERATMMYFVEKESLSISLGSRKHPQILGEIHAGGMMGESIFQDGEAVQHRSADVVAAKDGTVLLAIPKESLIDDDQIRLKLQRNAREELARRKEANELLKKQKQDEIKKKIASLSPEQHLEQLALFRVFDEDGDGTISREEIDDFLHKLGFAVKDSLSVKAIQKSIHAFGDTINFQSFASWILKQQELAEARHKVTGHSPIHNMMFNILDADHSGEITLHELQAFTSAEMKLCRRSKLIILVETKKNNIFLLFFFFILFFFKLFSFKHN